MISSFKTCYKIWITWTSCIIFTRNKKWWPGRHERMQMTDIESVGVNCWQSRTYLCLLRGRRLRTSSPLSPSPSSFSLTTDVRRRKNTPFGWSSQQKKERRKERKEGRKNRKQVTIYVWWWWWYSTACTGGMTRDSFPDRWWSMCKESSLVDRKKMNYTTTDEREQQESFSDHRISLSFSLHNLSPTFIDDLRTCVRAHRYGVCCVWNSEKERTFNFFWKKPLRENYLFSGKLSSHLLLYYAYLLACRSTSHGRSVRRAWSLCSVNECPFLFSNSFSLWLNVSHVRMFRYCAFLMRN